VNEQHPLRPARADIAVTVAALLTGSLTADQQLGDVDHAEAIAITQAIGRLLLGTPLRSDGKLTVKTLAAEAGLRRNKLTHKHTGLKDLFYALVKAQHTQPAIAVDLHAENDQLRLAVAGLRQTNREQAETLKRFARVVHVLEVENRQLRDHAADPQPTIPAGIVRFPRAHDAGADAHDTSPPDTPNHPRRTADADAEQPAHAATEPA
jgi:hypothetical protein